MILGPAAPCETGCLCELHWHWLGPSPSWLIYTPPVCLFGHSLATGIYKKKIIQPHRTSYLSCLSMHEHGKRTCLPLLNWPVAIVSLKFRSTGSLALRVPLHRESMTSPCQDTTVSEEGLIACFQCTITAAHTSRAHWSTVCIVMRCILRASALYRRLLTQPYETPTAISAALC